MKFEAASLDILPLRPDHDRGAFECGNQHLDRYIRQQARQDVARGVARVFVATDAESSGRILGYYTLGATSIAPKDLPQDVERRLPRLPVPAALIGRLAVDRQVAGHGLRKILLADALLKSEIASESLAVAALVVDPIDDSARAFYRAFGFRDALGSHNQMFLMRRIGKTSMNLRHSVADTGVEIASKGIASISALQRQVTQRLNRAFADDGPLGTPDLDARLLVGHALGLDASGLIVHADRTVSDDDVARVLALAERRIAGEPVARILGEKEFWSLTLRLSPETLVPRPDTETVVEAALAWVRHEGRRRDSLAILDLGTGSGAILLALLSELPDASGVGIDVAEGAARTARGNALRLGLGDRARFAVADWTSGIAGRFDIVASNPPYIKAGDISELPLEVARFDPQIALDGGADGLAAYRVILARVDAILADDGVAFLEVGAGQAEAVSESAEMLGFEARRHKDLVGIDRVVQLRRVKTPRQKLGLEIDSETARFRVP